MRARRPLVLLASVLTGALAIGALAGCATGAASSNDFQSSAQVAGAAALANSTGSSVPSSTPTDAAPNSGSLNWHDTIGCPDGISKGMTAVLPSSIKVVKKNPTSQDGVPGDPTLLGTLVPSCYFALSAGTISKVEYIFLDMPQAYLATFGTHLTSAGYTRTSTTTTNTGVTNGYSKGSALIVLAYTNPTAATGNHSYVVITG